jgi:hypothetical protein
MFTHKRTKKEGDVCCVLCVVCCVKIDTTKKHGAEHFTPFTKKDFMGINKLIGIVACSQSEGRKLKRESLSTRLEMLIEIYFISEPIGLLNMAFRFS